MGAVGHQATEGVSKALVGRCATTRTPCFVHVRSSPQQTSSKPHWRRCPTLPRQPLTSGVTPPNEKALGGQVALLGLRLLAIATNHRLPSWGRSGKRGSEKVAGSECYQKQSCLRFYKKRQRLFLLLICRLALSRGRRLEVPSRDWVAAIQPDSELGLAKLKGHCAAVAAVHCCRTTCRSQPHSGHPSTRAGGCPTTGFR